MGELEGTYRVLQTPGARLGGQAPVGVSTLEPGQSPAAAAARLQVRVELLDGTVEAFAVEVRCRLSEPERGQRRRGVPHRRPDFACRSS